MSQFYGLIRGYAKTAATRQGSKESGLSAHISGWNSGVKVFAHSIGGEDCFTVSITKGSNKSSSVLSFTFSESDINDRKQLIDLVNCQIERDA